MVLQTRFIVGHPPSIRNDLLACSDQCPRSVTAAPLRSSLSCDRRPAPGPFPAAYNTRVTGQRPLCPTDSTDHDPPTSESPFMATESMLPDTKTWPDLAIGLYDCLTG